MRNRMISVLLALCMVLSMAVPALAAEGDGAELPKLPAPEIRVLEEDEVIDGMRYQKGEIIVTGFPDEAPDCRFVVRHENGEIYQNSLYYGYSLNKNKYFKFNFGSYGEPPKTEVYSISVRYIGNGKTHQDSDWTTIEYAYTDPGTYFRQITNPHWKGVNPEYTLPDNTNEEWFYDHYWEASVRIQIKLLKESGNLSERYGCTSTASLIKDDFIKLLNECGEGNFVFRARIYSNNILKVNHGPWSEWSEPLHISPSGVMAESLGEIGKDLTAESTEEQKAAVVKAVRALDTQLLTTALSADHETAGAAKEMAELEEKLGVKAAAIKTEDAGFELDVDKIDIIGAGLNSKDLTPPTLTISHPESDLAVPDFYQNTVQMDLSLGDAVEKNEDGTLLVPIRITMPVPEGIFPQRLRILHFMEDGKIHNLIPHVYQDEDGTWLASFVVNHLSPFAFVEQAATITFDPNGGEELEQKTVQTNAAGKLESLPTPSRTNYTFEGWYTAKEGGEQVTTDNVFTQDTTIYARWKAVDSGNSGSGGGGGGSFGGGGGGGSATTPSKPTTPTTPTQPTTPEQTKPETPAVNAAEQFTDVQAGAWYEQSVNYVLEKGLMQGTGEKTFAPDATLSRAMLAQILYNNEGRPAAKGEGKFSDVSGGWYAEAVAWAGENGIVTGNADGTFNPNGAITREQIAVILYRYARQKGYDTSKKADLSAFADAETISDYAKEAMAWANAAGLINGMDKTTLAPVGNATRAQVAAILMRFLQSVEK